MMIQDRPYSNALNRLTNAGLRPTRQRLALARLLFECAPHHVTAEQLYSKAQREKVKVSLATVYNTLHQFKDAGLLREVVVEPGRSYFDTNLSDHHHFYRESTGELIDFPVDTLTVGDLPPPPSGTSVSRVDVIIRLQDN
ncbi:Fur family iron response transcriptional regulator [Aestuariispira insulae]|uniref:Ferric uptake regulation protein n=2 Tax=Aestuariispira insulae TaxID=1461337 RepID=A0A3D9HE09_9PROT|nr:Fur family iron response transcriptional regulator [Aestuariispira insulae]